MKRNVLNYWIDVGIGVSFVLSAISGLIFLLPVAPGSSGVLGIPYPAWSDLHTWSSLGLMAGVLAHLLLHWKWIAGMTRKMLRPAREPQEVAAPAPGRITRRQFLSLGLAAAATGAIVAGWALLARVWPVDAERDNSAPDSDTVEPASAGDPLQDEPEQPVDSTPDPGSPEPLAGEPEQSAQPPGGVACPRGMVNDPYPGRCRHYTDRNGDGICDYSVPGSGNN